MPMFSKILVPVAFSARCEGAVQYAEALACHFHAEMVLLHVVAPVPTYWCPDAVVMSPEVTAEAVEQSKAELGRFLEGSLKGISVSRVVQEGDPAQQIVEFAHEGKFDLIVMPTHGYGPFRRFLLGSVTAKVLHDADCPVWTGPHMEEAPPYPKISFRRILCAIDLGPHSRAVLEWGAGFAREYGADLDIVHAIPASTVSVGGFYFDPEWRTHVVNEARERIGFLQEDFGLSAQIRIETGDPSTAVRAVAEESQSNMVVIGRGHAGVLGRLRANAYAIIRESPCPVAAI
ncbi:MAG: universal stress protein [Acidobacteriia bacterium]|nr:universal stress protein [Terriglobia bacterium]